MGSILLHLVAFCCLNHCKFQHTKMLIIGSQCNHNYSACSCCPFRTSTSAGLFLSTSQNFPPPSIHEELCGSGSSNRDIIAILCLSLVKPVCSNDILALPLHLRRFPHIASNFASNNVCLLVDARKCEQLKSTDVWFAPCIVFYWLRILIHFPCIVDTLCGVLCWFIDHTKASRFHPCLHLSLHSHFQLICGCDKY